MNSEFAIQLTENKFVTYTELIAAWQIVTKEYEKEARGPAKTQVLENWTKTYIEPAIILLAQSAELNKIEQELG